MPQQIDILSLLAEARNAYSYSADGVKLRVVKKYNSNFNTSPVIGSAVNVSSMDVTKTTDYVAGKIFENGTLDRIFVDGGYIKDGVYYFYETDHLGSNRLTVSQEDDLIERNDYYPYGMQMAHNQLTNEASGSDNKRKFSGKEQDVMHGLNLYDFSARSQDPTLGRFTTVDPEAEELCSWSPYAYCLSDPMKHVDPDGEFPWVAALVGAAIDYASQVAINRIEGKSWSASLTNVDAKSIAVSAAVSATGVGLANVVGKVSKAMQVSSKVAAAIKVSGNVAVDASMSATSQLIKDGKIDAKSVVVDAAAGYAGGKLGDKMKSIKRNSQEGKVLQRQADHAKRVAGDNPRASRAEKSQAATKKSENYGNKSATATSTAASGAGSTTYKIVDDDKKK